MPKKGERARKREREQDPDSGVLYRPRGLSWVARVSGRQNLRLSPDAMAAIGLGDNSSYVDCKVVSYRGENAILVTRNCARVAELSPKQIAQQAGLEAR